MSKKIQKSNHDEFLELADRLKRSDGDVTLDRAEIGIITNQGEWLNDYIEGRRKAAKQTKNPGTKRKADSEIKPESLRKRELRAMKKK